MTGKSRPKKKKQPQKTEEAPAPPPREIIAAPADPRSSFGTSRKIDGIGFWRYKAQLMEDKTIILRDEILFLRRTAADQRSKVATLTKLISELEDQLAGKEGEVIEFEKKFLDAERLGVQRGNTAVLTELQINPNTHDIKMGEDCLVVEQKPREYQKK